jgi:hypothetical protein
MATPILFCKKDVCLTNGRVLFNKGTFHIPFYDGYHFVMLLDVDGKIKEFNKPIGRRVFNYTWMLEDYFQDISDLSFEQLLLWVH